MKKLFLYFTHFFLLFFSFSSYSQYIQGFVLTTANDTIKGYLFDGNLAEKTKIVKFKKNLKEKKVTRYSPTDLQSYTIGEEIFVTKSTSNSPLDSLVFLKEIVKGDISLYLGTNKAGNAFFIEKNNQLIYLKKKVLLGQLKISLTECKEFDFDSIRFVRNIDYTQDNLSGLVTKYNKCINPTSEVIVSKKNKLRFVKGIKLGVNNSLYKVTTPSYYADSYSKVGYSADVNFGIILPANFSAHLELKYLYTGGKGSRTVEYPMAAPLVSKVNFNLHYFTIPILFKYSISSNTIKPYLLAGPQLVFKIAGKGKVTNSDGWEGAYLPGTEKRNDFTPVHENTAINTSSFGFASGLGLAFSAIHGNKAFVEFRYNYIILSSGINTIAKLIPTEFMVGVEF